jgi:hypothetical protein
MNNPNLKYAVIILLERKYKVEEIMKLFDVPKWKIYQHNSHYKKALALIEEAKLKVV